MDDLGEDFQDDLSFGNTFRDMYRFLGHKSPNEELQDQLVDWHIAHLEFSHAQEYENLSLRHCEQDGKYELKGNHNLLYDSNSKLVEALSSGLNIIYNHKVKEIRYGGSDVKVIAEDSRKKLKCFRAKAVVVTVPLGVLKKKVITFNPPLPPRKQKAIDNIGFGLLNKCVLLFPRCFWGGHKQFGFVNKDSSSDERGRHFLFYSWDHVAGAPVLLALTSGSAARKHEEETKEEIKDKMMERLRLIFGKEEVPEPIDIAVSRWGKDEFAYGSYSSIVLGSSGETYDILAEDISKR